MGARKNCLMFSGVMQIIFAIIFMVAGVCNIGLSIVESAWGSILTDISYFINQIIIKALAVSLISEMVYFYLGLGIVLLLISILYLYSGTKSVKLSKKTNYEFVTMKKGLIVSLILEILFILLLGVACYLLKDIIIYVVSGVFALIELIKVIGICSKNLDTQNEDNTISSKTIVDLEVKGNNPNQPQESNNETIEKQPTENVNLPGEAQNFSSTGGVVDEKFVFDDERELDNVVPNNFENPINQENNIVNPNLNNNGIESEKDGESPQGGSVALGSVFSSLIDEQERAKLQAEENISILKTQQNNYEKDIPNENVIKEDNSSAIQLEDNNPSNIISNSFSGQVNEKIIDSENGSVEGDEKGISVSNSGISISQEYLDDPSFSKDIQDILHFMRVTNKKIMEIVSQIENNDGDNDNE